jgi:penicillin-binding protein-related factor A (putative recombinase)
MFCLLLYETVVHITDRVLIDRKTIKHFVNEYELQIKCFLLFCFSTGNNFYTLNAISLLFALIQI